MAADGGGGYFAGGCLAPGEERFRDEVTDLFRPDMDAAELTAGLDYLLTADLRPRQHRTRCSVSLVSLF